MQIETRNKVSRFRTPIVLVLVVFDGLSLERLAVMSTL
jgi:hypothetical protein